jgi:multidrug transporter EmrE-like cation transporter
VPAVIAYPTFSVGTIIITTLSGVLLFKESLRKTQWIALIGILVSLVLLNI